MSETNPRPELTAAIDAAAEARRTRVGLIQLVQLIRGNGAYAESIAEFLDMVDVEKLPALIDAIRNMLEKWPVETAEGLNAFIDAGLDVLRLTADATKTGFDDSVVAVIDQVAKPGPLRDFLVGLVAQWILTKQGTQPATAAIINMRSISAKSVSAAAAFETRAIDLPALLQLAALLWKLFTATWWPQPE